MGQSNSRIELYMHETVPWSHACIRTYVYGTGSPIRVRDSPIRVWDSPIRAWDVPYACIAIIIDQFTLKYQATTVAIRS